MTLKSNMKRHSFAQQLIIALIIGVFAGNCLQAQLRQATIHINAAQPAAYKIPRTIYGTFLEPIGNAIYTRNGRVSGVAD